VGSIYRKTPKEMVITRYKDLTIRIFLAALFIYDNKKREEREGRKE
jgi:hypothetical protein